MKLVLASKSPRRQQLLQAVHLHYELRTKDTEENYPADLPLEEVPVYLAEKKAMAFLDEIAEDEILLTADTVVILDNEIIGKPADLNDARKMLQKLSGKKHTVISGVCFLGKHQKISFSETTEVFFKTLTIDEIEFYLTEKSPLDKAGAYGIQDWIGLIGVQRIEGCFYNVMGLPVSRVYEVLKNMIDTQVE